MKRAVNPQTGEVAFLVNNQWIPPAKTAVNPEGQKAFLVGNEWVLDTPIDNQLLNLPEPETEGTQNPLMGALGRGAGLIGSGIEAVAEVGKRTGLAAEGPDGQPDVGPLRGLAKYFKDIEADIGYAPSTKLGDLADNPLTAVPFIAERIISSTPDMAAAMAALPAYIGTRTYEILDERVKNDNKTMDDATVGDVSAALSAALVEGTLERFATGRIFKPGTEGATALGRIGKETGIQSGTEAVEESAAYLGETLGTETGTDPKELFFRSLEGAIVGGGLGAGVQGTKEVLGRKKEEVEPEVEPKTEVDTEADIETEATPVVETEEVDADLEAAIAPATEYVEEVEPAETVEEVADELTGPEPAAVGAGVDLSGEPGGVQDAGVLDEIDTAGVPSVSDVEAAPVVGEGEQPPAVVEEAEVVAAEEVPPPETVAPSDTPELVTPSITPERPIPVEAPPGAIAQPGPVIPEREQTRRAMQAGMEQDRIEAEELQKTLKESYENPSKSFRLQSDPSRPEIREEYELAREDAKTQDMAFELPAWGKLTTDEKYIFLGALPQNATALDYTRALGALENYRTYVRDSGFEKEERNAIAGYEEARPVYSRILGANLPRWGDLSEQAQLAYLDINKNNSPVQQDAGMMALAESLGEQGILNITPIARERARLQQSERLAQLNSVRRAELEAERTRQRREDRPQDRALERAATDAPTTVGEGLNQYQSDSAVQSVVNEGGTVLNLLDTIAERASDRRVGVLAGELADLVRQIGIQTLDIKINFGKVKQGADGRFDPKTNTITLSGKDGQYTGTRSLTEASVHEVMHLLTDHVIDNRISYLKSIPDANKRKEIQTALNRLQNNFQRAKAKLGKRFNIPTIKEFIAEAYSNSEFQMALIDLDRQENLLRVAKGAPEKAYSPTNLLDDFRQFIRNVAQALGIAPPESAANFKEVIDDIAQLISLPTTDMRGRSVSYAQAKQAKKAPSQSKISLDKNNPDYEVEQTVGESALRRAMKRASFTRAAEVFQNFRQRVRNWEEQMRLAGKIIESGPNANNMFSQISLAIGRAEILFKENIQAPVERVHGEMNKVMKAIGKDAEGALQYLHKLTEAIHEPERRFVKYLIYVPLSTKRNLVQAGKQISPAERRTQIMDLLERPKRLTDAQIKSLRTELENLVSKYKDPLGYSPLRSEKDTAAMPIALTDDLYNVTAMDAQTAADIRDEYENNTEIKPVLDGFLDALSELRDATTQLDRQANYWSDPVDNFVRFYGWENYIPLKGVRKDDDVLDFNSKRMGREFQEVAQSFAGRGTTSNNPIMQMLSDAARSASRAGRAEYVNTIYNAVDQGLVPNAKIKEQIKFTDRDVEIPKAKKENTIFKHNKDGSVDVIEFADKKFADAIRKTYEAASPTIDIMNRVTGFFGQMHTRYNYAFAPLNFVRDSITNAFVVSAEISPKVMKDIISATTAKVMKGGLYKAGRVAALYEKGDIKTLKELAKKDSIYKDLVEYIEQGGAVSYVESIALRDKLQELNREVLRTNKGRIVRAGKAIESVFSIYNNAFEFAARASAYGTIKNHFMKNEGMSEKDAIVRTTAYVKNFANFEQIGERGRMLGAFFMFFRPAATGAVRAIEAVMPAFRTMDQAMKTLPPAILQDPKALAEFKKNYSKRRKTASVTAAGLFGVGIATYLLSALTADDDELGRNATLNDNMDQWERYARFHIPKAWTEAAGISEPIIFQMPWGFGLGAFASAGAQIAAVGSGTQSATDAMANIFLNVALDSYLPLPVSRMNPTEYPMGFFIDSIMPSAVRPLVQFAMNKDGLGRDIYPESYRRVVDAYTSSDRVPVIYKDAAKYLFEETGGEVSITPNTLFFLANSYLDGASRLVHDGYGAYQLMSGQKGFQPKNDTYLFSSFFGAKSNIESRDFAKVEQQLREKAATMKALEGRPEALSKRLEKYPMDAVLVQMYNHDVNQGLRTLRSEAARIRASDYSEKDKMELLRSNLLMQRLIKRNLLDKYEAYDIKP